METDLNLWTPTRIFICLKDEFKFPEWWIGDKDIYFIDIKSRKGETSLFDGKMAIVGDTPKYTFKLCEIGITESFRCRDKEEEFVITSAEEFTMSISVVKEIKKGKPLKVPKKIPLEYKTLPPLYV